jgi:hypothetical protein
MMRRAPHHHFIRKGQGAAKLTPCIYLSKEDNQIMEYSYPFF